MRYLINISCESRDICIKSCIAECQLSSVHAVYGKGNIKWCQLFSAGPYHLCVKFKLYINISIEWNWYRSGTPEVPQGKSVLKICSKFTEELSYQSAISLKFLCNFIQITLQRGHSHVNLLNVFIIPFPKNISGGLLLLVVLSIWFWSLVLVVPLTLWTDFKHVVYI